ELGRGPEIELIDGARGNILELDLWQLLNVSPKAALDAADLFRAEADDRGKADRLISRHSLGGLGYQEFGRRLGREFRDALPPAVVIVPSTAHYSWEK